MDNTILATFDDKKQALQTAQKISEQAAVDSSAISLYTADSASALEAIREVERERNEGHVRAATVGFSILGAGLGSAVGAFSMVIPIVPLLALGGGVAMGLAGRLGAEVVTDAEQAEFERLLRRGGMLMLVRAENEAMARDAMKVLEHAPTRQLRTAA